MVSAELGPAVLVVCGPTGAGKGALARELAERLSGEIVYADSRKIYRGLDIGTAKPSRAEQIRVPHHLLDVCAPGETFSAFRFRELADRAIADILARARFPIVVAGTGLYLRALLHGMIDTPPRDDRLRDSLWQEELQNAGVLRRRLLELDPESASRIPPGDQVRTIRALEVYALTGERLSRIQQAHGFRPQRYRPLKVAPNWPRAQLDERINERVDRMLAAGWLEEVARLRQGGAGEGRALKVLGYLRLDQVLDGQYPLIEAVTRIKCDHRRYARRQLTWFRADPEVRWLKTPVDVSEVTLLARQFLDGKCA